MELKHLERMIPWLRKLASSIHGLLPEALGSKSNLPPLKAVWEWVDSLTLKAFEVIERHTITAEGLERLERGGDNRQKGPSARADVWVTLEELYLGATRDMSIARNIYCQKCRGTGAKDGKTK